MTKTFLSSAILEADQVDNILQNVLFILRKTKRNFICYAEGFSDKSSHIPTVVHLKKKSQKGLFFWDEIQGDGYNLDIELKNELKEQTEDFFAGND